LSNYPEGRVS